MQLHVVSAKTYVLVWFVLIILTVITVWIAEFDFGKLNTVVAMSVAGLKAFLVASIFMGLKYSSGLTKVWAVTGIIFLIIMFGLTMGDYVSRWFTVQGW